MAKKKAPKKNQKEKPLKLDISPDELFRTMAETVYVPLKKIFTVEERKELKK